MKKPRERIRRASLGDLRAMTEKGEVRRTPKDAPTHEIPERFWEDARPFVPVKKPVNLRVDEDVLEFFRAGGKGHLTRMNAVLRSYVEAQRRSAPRKAGRSKA